MSSDLPVTDDDANDIEDGCRICIVYVDSEECDGSCVWNGCVVSVDCAPPGCSATPPSIDIEIATELLLVEGDIFRR